LQSFKDPATEIRERFANSLECRGLKHRIEECEKRVAGGSDENCEEELYDFMKCVDKLVCLLEEQFIQITCDNSKKLNNYILFQGCARTLCQAEVDMFYINRNEEHFFFFLKNLYKIMGK